MSGSVAGAEITTFFAPASRCLAASSRLVKKPVDSSTTSAPRSRHGRAARSRSARALRRAPAPRGAARPRPRGRVALGQALEAVAVDDDVVAVELDGARVRPEDRVVLEQMGERLGVRQVVDRHELDVRAGRLGGAEEVASDPAEAVDADT